MDYKQLSFWFDLLQFLIVAAVSVYVWFSNRHRADKKEIQEMGISLQREIRRLDGDVEARLDEHDSRIATAESQIKRLPTHSDIGKIHEKINDVDRMCNHMNGTLEGVKSSVTIIQQHLIRK